MNPGHRDIIAKALKFAEQGQHGDLAMSTDRAAGTVLSALRGHGYLVVSARDLECALSGVYTARENVARERLLAALDSALGFNRAVIYLNEEGA